MKIRWLNRATDSLTHIHNWIAEENPRAAKQAAVRVRSATQQLAKFPASGRLGEVAGTRELVVAPYIVVYRVVDEEVHILRVFRDAQQRHIE